MPSHTTQARDSALRRLRRTNRWLIAGSVVLTGVLSDVAANAFAGKTIKASATGKPASGNSSSRTSTTKAKPLSPPAQAPQATTPEAQSSESQQAAPESSQQAAPSQETAPSQESAPAVSGGS
ncbi:MAG TPA: hypothetical protein VGH78_01415 [Solirubrobacteraceae bacterium]